MQAQRNGAVGAPLGLTTGEAARFLGVSVGTVRRWSDDGHLSAYRTPGGQRRYSPDLLARFAEGTLTGPEAPVEPAPDLLAVLDGSAEDPIKELLRLLGQQERRIAQLEGEVAELARERATLRDRVEQLTRPLADPRRAAIVLAELARAQDRADPLAHSLWRLAEHFQARANRAGTEREAVA